MRNLEKRLEKLEHVYTPAEIIVIMITHFGQGEIKGWGAEGLYIARNPGESEEALAGRAAAEARAHYNQHPSLASGHIVLQMDREYVPKTSRWHSAYRFALHRKKFSAWAAMDSAAQGYSPRARAGIPVCALA